MHHHCGFTDGAFFKLNAFKRLSFDCVDYHVDHDDVVVRSLLSDDTFIYKHGQISLILQTTTNLSYTAILIISHNITT